MKLIGQTPFNDSQANLEDRQVPAIFAIDETALTISNGPSTDRNEPDVEQSHSQGQPGQTIKMAQHRCF